MKWTHVFLFVLGLGASAARYLASPFPDGSENPVVALMALNAPVLLWLMRGLDGFLERDRELFGLPQNKENANGMGSLDQAIEKAWRAFDRSTGLPSRITHVAPILFFGDLDAYGASPVRVLTVGLNPALHEFLVGEPFRRFPLLTGVSSDRESGRYLNAMSAYFRTDPYRVWFDRGFEKALNGPGASYYKGAVSTALHTDICSPVPSSPTWSKLGPADRAALEAEGGPLWHMLLEALRPHMVVLSVAKSHLKRIQFTPMTEWEAIHMFKRKGNGDTRSRPYEVRARSYEVDGERSLFVFGPAAQTPFGLLDDDRKGKVGAIVRKRFQKTIGTASLSAAFRRAPSPQDSL